MPLHARNNNTGGKKANTAVRLNVPSEKSLVRKNKYATDKTDSNNAIIVMRICVLRFLNINIATNATIPVAVASNRLMAFTLVATSVVVPDKPSDVNFLSTSCSFSKILPL